MFRRLVETFRINILGTIPEFLQLLSTAATITSQSIFAAVKDDVDETWNMEAFDELLEAWSSLCTFRLDALLSCSGLFLSSTISPQKIPQ